MNEQEAIELLAQVTEEHAQCMDCVAYIPSKIVEDSGDFRVTKDRCLSCRLTEYCN